jgi:hypothetical protein
VIVLVWPEHLNSTNHLSYYHCRLSVEGLGSRKNNVLLGLPVALILATTSIFSMEEVATLCQLMSLLETFVGVFSKEEVDILCCLMSQLETFVIESSLNASTTSCWVYLWPWSILWFKN